MKIRDLKKESRGSLSRVSATVEWEESSRPPLEIFYETEAEHDNEFQAHPDGILTACLLPAMRHGEKRISLEGPVCPRLSEGLAEIIQILHGWFGPPRPGVRIEPAKGFRAPFPRKPRRSGLLLTGGADSLHLLWRNRRDFPLDHPDSFRTAIAVFGLFPPGRIETPSLADYSPARSALSDIAADAGLELIPIVTNVRKLDTDLVFLAREFIASALCSAVHLLTGAVSSISLASGRNVRLLVPVGTHPLIDPRLGSGALEVRHVGVAFKRIDRIRELCAWEAGIRNLAVCLEAPPPKLNCGKCEKCLRTMTALEAFGSMRAARQFPFSRVSREMLESVSVTPHVSDYWFDLVEPLRVAGRDDLIAVIRRKLEQAERSKRWLEDSGWRGRLRRVDRKITGGRIVGLRRRFGRS